VPLRERISDIPLLAAHFVALICKRYNRDEPRLTQANVKQLQAYHWPGNVRELQNIIERAVIVGSSGRLEFDLPGKASLPVSENIEVETDPGAAQPFNEQERLDRDRTNIMAALKNDRRQGIRQGRRSRIARHQANNAGITHGLFGYREIKH
jgi:DNA-binding NtrC family response regulator